MADKDVLETQDEGFARRLNQRDKSVLIEIDRAYSAGLRRSLRRFGPLWDV